MADRTVIYSFQKYSFLRKENTLVAYDQVSTCDVKLTAGNQRTDKKYAQLTSVFSLAPEAPVPPVILKIARNVYAKVDAVANVWLIEPLEPLYDAF